MTDMFSFLTAVYPRLHHKRGWWGRRGCRGRGDKAGLEEGLDGTRAAEEGQGKGTGEAKRRGKGGDREEGLTLDKLVVLAKINKSLYKYILLCHHRMFVFKILVHAIKGKLSSSWTR